MQSTPAKLGAAVFVIATLALSSAAPAQESPWRSFVSVSPLYEAAADLDGGGDFSVGGVILRGGTSRDLGGGNRAGITLNYDYFDYSFGNPVAFGGVAPWNIIQRYGFSLPTSFALRDGWSVGVTPSFDWFKENGAKSSDSLVWGATFSAVKRFDNGNLLGLGVAAFDRIEETSFFPFPIVDWRFGQRWRLINPLAAGPTGPAGLELDYLFDNGWTVGLGASYRVTRFRLSDSGPTPNGIGEVSGVPVFLRATRDLGKTTTLNLYGGVIASGELRVEDPSGNLIRKEEFDPAPFVGANFVARF
jgi:hypothetical protein